MGFSEVEIKFYLAKGFLTLKSVRNVERIRIDIEMALLQNNQGVTITVVPISHYETIKTDY